MTATTKDTSPDVRLADRFEGAACVNDIIATVARSERGGVKRLAQRADIPHRTMESWISRESDGSYQRSPDDRLFRLMLHNDEVLAGIMALIQKQRATCPKRSKTS
jgi:hypothetical protein